MLASAVALATLYQVSVPVLGTDGIYPLDWVWSCVAIAWAYSVYHYLEDDEAVRAGRLLLWVAFASLLGIVPYAILRYAGVPGGALAVGGVLVLLGLVIVHERPARLAWLIVPVIALGTLGLGVAGVPANVRLEMNEATLTAYARSVADGETPPLAFGDGVIEVGSLGFQRVDMFSGCVRLATTFVNVGGDQASYSGDEPAGLAYCPEGPPPDGGRRPVRYEPMISDWYRWLPVPAPPAP